MLGSIISYTRHSEHRKMSTQFKIGFDSLLYTVRSCECKHHIKQTHYSELQFFYCIYLTVTGLYLELSQ